MGSGSSKGARADEIQERYADMKVLARAKPDLFDNQKIAEWHNHFRKASDQKQGMSKKKFKSLYERFYPKANVGLFADLMFDYLDDDASGVIDFVEFYQVILVTELCLSDKVMEWVFYGADVNGNDSLDRQEVADLLVAIYEMGGVDTRVHPPNVDGFFDRVDATQTADDRITMTEWKSSVANDPRARNAFMKFGFRQSVS